LTCKQTEHHVTNLDDDTKKTCQNCDKQAKYIVRAKPVHYTGGTGYITCDECREYFEKNVAECLPDASPTATAITCCICDAKLVPEETQNPIVSDHDSSGRQQYGWSRCAKP
jgi:hypothetical protein